MSARTTTSRLTLAGVLALASLTLVGPSGATAAPVTAQATVATALPPLSAVDQRIKNRLATRSRNSRLGSDLTGLVTDARSGRVIWSKDRNERQLPASNTKIVTAVTALSSFGPRHRFTTRVVKGTYWRHVVLVGAGDPSLTWGKVDTLAASTAKAVRARGVRRVTVYVDDTLFPRHSLAYGWKRSYVPTDVRPVRALVVGKRKVWDTSIDAGKIFAGRLAARGVKVRAVTRGRARAGATTLGSVRGGYLKTMVGYMLRTSDNDHAEALHRLVARKAGYNPTWWGARMAQRKVLSRLGVDLGSSALYDGSGLSRADRLTAAQLVATLSLAFDGEHPRLAPLRYGAMAIAGRTGTLAASYLRYTSSPTKCAAGLIQAKTGSLSGVITLSGFARGADGRVKLFSFLLNGVPSTLTTRQAVDRLSSTITGCW
ncbi:MAG: D-alanyl-D-alanine carboxypeptidase/D-alanyl-D-alanine endopeptidase [Actinomycetes bacterium]